MPAEVNPLVRGTLVRIPDFKLMIAIAALTLSKGPVGSRSARNKVLFMHDR